jgi:ribose 5-phosphate isomerase B
MTGLIVPIASDHRGFELKSQCLGWIRDLGYAPKDLGTHDAARCDSLDFAVAMATEMDANPGQLGLLICGTGNGIAMAANRYRSLRAALCTNATMARLARQHNDANVLALGAHITGAEVARDCLETFLQTAFLGGRYAERRDKLTELGGL